MTPVLAVGAFAVAMGKSVRSPFDDFLRATAHRNLAAVLQMLGVVAMTVDTSVITISAAAPRAKGLRICGRCRFVLSARHGRDTLRCLLMIGHQQ